MTISEYGDSTARRSGPAAGEAEALVLGSGVTALGVIRSLAAAGIPSRCLTSEGDLVRRSRWFRPAPGSPAAAASDLRHYLDVNVGEPTVLFPCSDEWALRVAELVQTSPDRKYRCRCSKPEILRRVVDKAAFSEELRTAGIEHPETVPIRRMDDLEAVSAETWENAFLKPRDSQSFFRQYGRKGVPVTSLSEAVARWRELSAAGHEMVIQAYVPGPADHHVFVDGYVDRAGDLAILARRRLRMYPRDFGNSSFMVSVAPAEVQDAVGSVRRLLAHLEFRGFFSVELKYSTRDGRPKVLELNARPWWYVDFATQTGLNLCERGFRDALDQPVGEPSGYRSGVTLMYPYYDYFAVRELVQEGVMSRSRWLREWVSAKQPVFRVNDPVPAVVEAAGILWDKLRNSVRGASH